MDVWDELSHQQSQEIEQHQARTLRNVFYAANDSQPNFPQSNGHGSSSIETVQRVALRARDEVGRFTGDIYRSTVSAYQNRTPDRHSNRRALTTNAIHPPGYLDDFGISTVGDDPLLALLADFSNGDSTENGRPEQERQQLHQGEGNFVVLPKLSGRPTPEAWSTVSDLDLYLCSLYSFYYHRGLIPILYKGIVELVTLFLTLYLSIFLFAHVDWSKLATCTDETTCHGDFFKDYYIQNRKNSWSIWSALVRLYFFIFFAYGLFSLWTFWQNVKDARFAQRVFEDRLGIPAHKLEGGAVDWDRDVVAKLCELQQSGEYRVAVDEQQQLDALTVANRILRKENFLVAFFNRGLLDLSVPYVGHGLICASLEWSLHFCIFNFMFNHKFEVRQAFYKDPSGLKRRFVFCGIAHAAFMPFLLFFVLLYFGLRNAYDWKSTKQYLGPREWSSTAKWTFREFNELPHYFERRLAPSYDAAEEYLKLFGQNELMTAVGRILVFLGGSIGIVLFAFAAINDAILLHVKIADWNLLWYAGVAAGIYSAGKSMLPNGDGARPGYIRNIYAERDSALASVATHTHYYPDIWRGRGWDRINHKAFLSMFQFKAQLFLHEILALIFAPYILCVSLPRCAEGICEFVLAIKAKFPGAGEVCGYATFDFDQYGDENWEGRTLGKPERLSNGGNDEASKRNSKPKARHGKMEKSFFSFKGSNPSWKVSESGQHLVDRLEQYQREQTASLSREQQLHIDAAARQLETLARLEQQKPPDALRWSVTDAVNRARPLLPKQDEAYFAPLEAPPSPEANMGVFQRNTTRHASSQIKQGPPPTAFSHPSFQSPFGDERVNSNETDESDPAPFALNLAPSTVSVSPILASRRPHEMLSAVPPFGSSLSGTNSLALSADMLQLLSMSSLETGSLLDGTLSVPNEERQYMWLERYHAHLAAQGGNAETQSVDRPENIV